MTLRLAHEDAQNEVITVRVNARANTLRFIVF
jgi:hypothetical protein